jgi:two-component system, OmpR family, alkaline phosphatase synthesis response regulator PhoP
MKKRLNVLVVDDEPDVVEILAYNLIKNHHTVTRAYNGWEGLKAIEKSLPDLIILDVRMPVMNGLEMCRELRKNESCSDIPVLFLTADTDDYTAINAIDAGGNHFVTKPIRPAVLMGMIDELTF